jgi:hypothetical protein
MRIHDDQTPKYKARLIQRFWGSITDTQIEKSQILTKTPKNQPNESRLKQKIVNNKRNY